MALGQLKALVNIDTTTKVSAETPWIGISSAVFGSVEAAESFIEAVLYRYPKMGVMAARVPPSENIAAIVTLKQMTTVNEAQDAFNEIWAMTDEADGQYVSSVLDLAWQVTDPLKDRQKATTSV